MISGGCDMFALLARDTYEQVYRKHCHRAIAHFTRNENFNLFAKYRKSFVCLHIIGGNV